MHVLLRDIIAGRETRFEQEPGMLGVRDDHAAEDNMHMARTPQNIHPFVGVACVRKYLLILFIPGVHLVPVKGHIAFDLRPVRQWAGIAPRGMFGYAVADLYRPIGCLPFQW